jgi:hypothetical protein
MKKKRITTRVANQQRKKLTRQSIVILCLSILLGILFVAVILPNAVRFFFSILDKQTDLTQDSRLPPQTPIIATPTKFTNQSILNITGFAQPDTLIILTLDNIQQAETTSDYQGGFEIQSKLNQGENMLGLYSVDDKKNESTVLRYTVILDNTQPQIKIGSPENGSKFELRDNQTITVEGETEPHSKVLINNRLSIANSEGYFSQRYYLSEGENAIKIVVTDPAGNVAETELTVFFRI